MLRLAFVIVFMTGFVQSETDKEIIELHHVDFNWTTNDLGTTYYVNEVYNVSGNKPIEIMFIDWLLEDIVCGCYYYRNVFTTKSEIIGNNTVIKVLNVTAEMSTLWQCSLKENNTNIKYIFLEMLVKDAKPPQIIIVNGVVLPTQKASLNPDQHANYNTTYNFITGDKVDVACINPGSEKCAVQLNYSYADSLNGMFKGVSSKFRVGFRSKLLARHNMSRISCTYICPEDYPIEVLVTFVAENFDNPVNLIINGAAVRGTQGQNNDSSVNVYIKYAHFGNDIPSVFEYYTSSHDIGLKSYCTDCLSKHVNASYIEQSLRPNNLSKVYYTASKNSLVGNHIQFVEIGLVALSPNFAVQKLLEVNLPMSVELYEFNGKQIIYYEYNEGEVLSLKYAKTAEMLGTYLECNGTVSDGWIENSITKYVHMDTHLNNTMIECVLKLLSNLSNKIFSGNSRLATINILFSMQDLDFTNLVAIEVTNNILTPPILKAAISQYNTTLNSLTNMPSTDISTHTSRSLISVTSFHNLTSPFNVTINTSNTAELNTTLTTNMPINKKANTTHNKKASSDVTEDFDTTLNNTLKLEDITNTTKELIRNSRISNFTSFSNATEPSITETKNPTLTTVLFLPSNSSTTTDPKSSKKNVELNTTLTINIPSTDKANASTEVIENTITILNDTLNTRYFTNTTTKLTRHSRQTLDINSISNFTSATIYPETSNTTLSIHVSPNLDVDMTTNIYTSRSSDATVESNDFFNRTPTLNINSSLNKKFTTSSNATEIAFEDIVNFFTRNNSNIITEANTTLSTTSKTNIISTSDKDLTTNLISYFNTTADLNSTININSTPIVHINVTANLTSISNTSTDLNTTLSTTSTNPVTTLSFNTSLTVNEYSTTNASTSKINKESNRTLNIDLNTLSSNTTTDTSTKYGFTITPAGIEDSTNSTKSLNMSDSNTTLDSTSKIEPTTNLNKFSNTTEDKNVTATTDLTPTLNINSTTNVTTDSKTDYNTNMPNSINTTTDANSTLKDNPIHIQNTTNNSSTESTLESAPFSNTTISSILNTSTVFFTTTTPVTTLITTSISTTPPNTSLITNLPISLNTDPYVSPYSTLPMTTTSSSTSISTTDSSLMLSPITFSTINLTTTETTLLPSFPISPSISTTSIASTTLSSTTLFSSTNVIDTLMADTKSRSMDSDQRLIIIVLGMAILVILVCIVVVIYNMKKRNRLLKENSSMAIVDSKYENLPSHRVASQPQRTFAYTNSEQNTANNRKELYARLIPKNLRRKFISENIYANQEEAERDTLQETIELGVINTLPEFETQTLDAAESLYANQEIPNDSPHCSNQAKNTDFYSQVLPKSERNQKAYVNMVNLYANSADSELLLPIYTETNDNK